MSNTATTSANTAPHRAAYTPREFAALFGRKRGWAYRLIAEGRVTTICPTGRILVPASQVAEILTTK